MSKKLQNIKAIRELVRGDHKSQTRTTIGFTEKPKEKRNIGDIWFETDAKTGTVWKVEQKNGFRTRTVANSILQNVQQLLRVPEKCPECGCKMRNEEQRLNFKMYYIHKKCFSCVTKEETLIRAQGTEAWETYSRTRLLANAESWFRDVDREVEILRDSLKIQFVQNGEGDVENWDQTAFFEKFDNDYQQLKQNIIQQIQGSNNGS